MVSLWHTDIFLIIGSLILASIFAKLLYDYVRFREQVEQIPGPPLHSILFGNLPVYWAIMRKFRHESLARRIKGKFIFLRIFFPLNSSFPFSLSLLYTGKLYFNISPTIIYYLLSLTGKFFKVMKKNWKLNWKLTLINFLFTEKKKFQFSFIFFYFETELMTFLEEQWDQYKHHGVFRVWLGPFNPMFFLSKPETIETLLSSSVHLKKTMLYRFIHPLGGNGLILA